ncbi:TonB-dependent receptor plug domain-containing protein [Denitratisoma oestradiolicum]|uniref:Putative TonB-dependent receptor n=1 Tax=Denitratisoma oestradiolicum TaxID=311182 RepID=A0A6S6XV64_9PROT|nr:TonB-dependent receptor [Denitratisoma oestradiolicum]TWO79538.1 hypothetical protein CBW56_14050 [Denitratisoma oestradiolicum]CAB1368073.1 putative TonB-dependent receptor [Denitratisoma oestradiolicum]
MNNLVRSLAALVPVLSILPSWAQDADSTDFPVVLTASRMKQSQLRAPSAVTVIDRAMIEKSGARQIADLMRFVPGAVVGYNDGNWPVVSLRGMSGVYVSALQVLLDGVSVYTPLWGGMQWADLPIGLDDVERIEVIRGPNAALFGPNAFSGVINIITREPAADRGSRISGNMGQGGTADIAYSHGGSAADWTYRASIGQRATNGYTSRPDSQRLSYANLRAEYRIDGSNALQLTSRLSNVEKDVGDYRIKGDAMEPHTEYGRGMDFQMRWTRAESADNEFWLQYYHQQFRRMNHVGVDLRDTFSLPHVGPFANPLPYLIDIDFENQRDGVEFQQTLRLSQDLRSVWGLESRRDSVVSSRLMATRSEKTGLLTRGFASLEWQMDPQWTLHTAAMVERNTLASTAWSPKVALTYEPVSGHVLRASVSRAQRTPTMLEKYANYYYDVPMFGRIQYRQSTGVVDSESAVSQELGYAFEYTPAHLTLDMRWFRDRYRGLTGMVNKDIVNQDDVDVEGGDLTLRWEPMDGTRLRLAYAGNQVKSTDLGGAYSISVPSNTLSMFWDQTLPQTMDFSLNYQRVSKMFWLDAGQKKRIMPAIDYLNLRLAKRLNLGPNRAELAWVMQNALGHHREYYLGILGTPDNIPTRTSFIHFSLEY